MKAQWILSALAALPLLNGCGGGNTTPSATRYVITDVGGDFSDSQAYALNNLGQVVGQGTYPFTGGSQSANNSSSGLAPATAFLYADGKATALKNTGLIALNDSGQIVGYSGIYRNGAVTPLPSLATSNSGATVSLNAAAINNQGQIAGSSDVGLEEAAHPVHAALYADGQVTDLGTLGEPPAGSGSPPSISYATALNNNGQVVGFSTTSAPQTGVYPMYRGFLWQNGKMAALETLGGDYSSATAINDNGLIVGTATPVNSSTPRAVYWQNGQIHDIAPSGLILYAAGVNNAGYIVGSMQAGLSAAKTPISHAYLYYNSQVTDLNQQIPANSGWELNDARAINNKGQICGTGTYKGTTHAFLLTPQ